MSSCRHKLQGGSWSVGAMSHGRGLPRLWHSITVTPHNTNTEFFGAARVMRVRRRSFIAVVSGLLLPGARVLSEWGRGALGGPSCAPSSRGDCAPAVGWAVAFFAAAPWGRAAARWGCRCACSLGGAFAGVGGLLSPDALPAGLVVAVLCRRLVTAWQLGCRRHVPRAGLAPSLALKFL